MHPCVQAYCHHFFGPSSLLVGEGAEIRGSIDRQPLPAPYYAMVNGSYFAEPSTRRDPASRPCDPVWRGCASSHEHACTLHCCKSQAVHLEAVIPL